MSYKHAGRPAPHPQPKALKHDRLRERSRESRPTGHHSDAMGVLIQCLNAGAHAGIVAYQDAVNALLPDILPAIELTERDGQDLTRFTALTTNPPYAPDATWRGLFASLLTLALDAPTCDSFIAWHLKRVARADIPPFVDSSPNTGSSGRYSPKSGTWAGWVTASVLNLALELHALVPDAAPLAPYEQWREHDSRERMRKAQARTETKRWHAQASVQYDAKTKREYTQSHGVLTRDESRAVRKQHAGAVKTTWRHH